MCRVHKIFADNKTITLFYNWYNAMKTWQIVCKS